MIRYTHINNLVLSLYTTMSSIKFPLNTKNVIDYIQNCKYLSYQDFAEINHCSLSDVIQLCESKSGCTHYDVKQNRYLILCNQSTANNNNSGRQRWTCGHEIGHVMCKHHVLSAYDKLSENSLLKISNPEYESEADYFASVLLAPFPLFKVFNIQNTLDIQSVFGLSAEASQYRLIEYQKWLNHHRKTAWENDILKIYYNKLPHAVYGS